MKFFINNPKKQEELNVMEKEIVELQKAVYDGDRDLAKKLAQKVLDHKIDPVKTIETGLAPKMKQIGDEFERLEIFLPQIMLSAEAMNSALEVLIPAIKIEKLGQVQKSTVVVGTVKGDVHDIGKSIVGMMLQTAGFKVIDLGKDVPVEAYVDAAIRNNAKIIGVSTLLTSCRGYVKEVLEEVERRKLRDKLKLMCGGGGLDAGYSEEIGYDGFGDTATQAIRLAEKFSKGG
jgi:corrinoid protein of di/trimethylamine methyltransferase